MNRICPSCEQYMEHPTEFRGKKFCNDWCALDWAQNGEVSIKEAVRRYEEMNK